jgi:uncharacterized protein
MITLNQIKQNSYLLEFIKHAEKRLLDLNYTSHGLDHCQLVADRARSLASEIGLGKKDQEICAISAFCHDVGNFLSRTYHNYLGSLIFQQIFQKDFAPDELASIMEAIVNHDKDEMKFTDAISAVLVLADKSDVRQNRVTVKDKKIIEQDIHNRVNFAVIYNKLDLEKKTKRIILRLKIDTEFVPIMEYFEIFTERMVYCRKAAECLGYKFGLVINDFKLL